MGADGLAIDFSRWANRQSVTEYEPRWNHGRREHLLQKAEEVLRADGEVGAGDHCGDNRA